MSVLLSLPSRKRASVLLAVGGYVNTAIIIVQGLFLMPLYLHYIGAHTYGLWLASGGMLGMLGVVNFGVGNMVIQRVASSYGKQDMKKAGVYFINGVLIYLGICLLAAMIGWLISIYLPHILKLSDSESMLIQQCFILALLGMVIAIFNECLRGFSQAMLRPVVPMIAMALGRIFGIALSVWMLFDDFGLWAIPAGTVLSEIIILLTNICYSTVLFRMLKTRITFDKKILKEYIHTSPALLGARAGQTLSQESEPLLITMFLTPEITSAYMIVRRAADIVFNLLSQVVGSTIGSFGHLAGSGKSDKIAEVAYGLLSLIALFGLLGFSIYIFLNEDFVTLWVGSEFILSPTLIALLGCAFFVRIVRSMVWQLLNGLNDFVYTSLCILFEGVIRVLIVLLAFPMFGIFAVPLGLLLATSLSFVVLIRRLNAKISFLFDRNTLLYYGVSLVVVLGASSYIAPFVNSVSWYAFLAWLLSSSLLSLFLIGGINWKVCLRVKRMFL